MNREALFYNALASSYASNYKALGKTRAKHNSWESAWNAESSVNHKEWDPEKLAAELEQAHVQLIMQESSDYPALLKEIPWPPFGIYVKGSIVHNKEKTLAIVGTRKATESSRELAKKFAHELASKGICIISGLAFGIDAAAHIGCLEAGGTTFAVLAQGLDSIYPRTHERLAEDILISGGALVSEYPLGSPTLPYRFLERNRIVSGLSEGTLVLEAPEASGSLATARFAMEQNREVFVLPGLATHPHFKGSHELIRNGAELVTETVHILQSLHMEEGTQNTQNLQFDSPEEKAIMEVIMNSGKSVSVDKIIELSKLRTHIVNQTLSLLLIKNAIKETGEGFSL